MFLRWLPGNCFPSHVNLQTSVCDWCSQLKGHKLLLFYSVDVWAYFPKFLGGKGKGSKKLESNRSNISVCGSCSSGLKLRFGFVYFCHLRINIHWVKCYLTCLLFLSHFTVFLSRKNYVATLKHMNLKEAHKHCSSESTRQTLYREANYRSI